MKVIRVTGCHDCDKKYVMKGTYPLKVFCHHPDIKSDNDIVDYYMSKTLPDNCPLDEIPEYLGKEIIRLALCKNNSVETILKSGSAK